MSTEENGTSNKSVGIRLENCLNGRIENVQGVGGDTLISAENSTGISVRKINYSGGRQAFEGRNVKDLVISDVTFTAGVGCSEVASKVLRTSEGQELLTKLKQAAQEGATDDDLQRHAQTSKVGQWLKNQKFTDWAGLVHRILEGFGAT
ncbi:hypothetical protein [Marinovum sp.]|uniref:hypothetical protein n=1 Tax=Marinovum sp. TaxID=2024839 RepID=UPI003A8DD9D7